MKYIFILLVILSYVMSVLGDLDAAKKCPDECFYIQQCVDKFKENNGQKKMKVTLYPPKDELGKCYCEDQNQYLNCMNCYNPKKGNSPVVAGVMQKYCENLVSENSQNLTNSLATQNDGNNEIGDTENNNNTSETGNNDGKSSKIGFVIVGAVAVVGFVGFVVYTRKQKERPESMPFFGNSATSPHQYATLNSSKEVNDISTSNLTSDYNTQFYSNVDTNNQYNYDQSNQDYNNSYDPNYQYGNQYPANNYENDVVAGSTAAVNASSVGANYESRRESMMPGSRPTSTNIPGAYVCAYKYDPQLDDELALQVDDQVQIIEEYEDGWMKAINLTTGKEGMAPRVCIKEA